MKRVNLLLLSFITIAIAFSCSKESVNQPEFSTLKEYPVDLIFDINADCRISVDSSGNPYGPQWAFMISASGNTRLYGENLKLDATLKQYALYDYNENFQTPVIEMKEQNTGNIIWFAFSVNQNFFQFPYNGGPADFSGLCYVYQGSGRYVSILKNGTNMLSVSGIADTTSNTGSLRIKGSIFF